MTATQKVTPLKEIIKVQFDIYGNADYGKRVFWIKESPIHHKGCYIWAKELQGFIMEMLSKGYEVLVNDSE